MTAMTHPLRVFIVDDETLARSRLRTLLSDCQEPICQLVGEAADAIQAIETLTRVEADVVLLDIHMPGANGLKLAGMLRSLPKPPALIFVTAHAGHAVTAFELEAVDYLTKPVRAERLQKSLQRVERITHEFMEQNTGFVPDHVLITDRGALIRVPLPEILFFKAELKYITVRTLTDSYLLETSLSELEAQFSARFLRIHRNTLVAKPSIRALEKGRDPDEGEVWVIRVEGLDELLPVSRRQLGAVREALSAQST